MSRAGNNYDPASGREHAKKSVWEAAYWAFLYAALLTAWAVFGFLVPFAYH